MRTLLSIDDTLRPADSKTVRSFAFTVPPGVAALTLVFEWDPAASDDVDKNRAIMGPAMAQWGHADWEQADVKRNLQRLPNLLNTVVVEPSGRWRGRSDRGKGTRDAPLLIDPLHPAPGFLAGPLEPGAWSVDLEVHAVVSEEVRFFLEVREAHAAVPASEGARVRPSLDVTNADRERATPLEAAGTAGTNAVVATDAAARATGGLNPPLRGGLASTGWFRGELHSHTRHSDGSHTVEELLRRASELGLDFLALTDHNTTSGAPELAANAFPTILGAELTTFRGHHVCLGLDEMVPWHRAGQVLHPSDVARAVRAKGALFTLTHPFNLGDPICTGCRWMTPELDLANVDLVEIWHRRWRGDSSDNAAARALWDDMWRRGLRPVGVGVRDWHNKNHEAELPGPLPTTVIRARSTAQADLLEGLKRGAAYITRGPRIELDVDGVPLGESGAAGSAATAHVDIDVGGGLAAGARVELYRCGEKIDAREIPTSARGVQHVELSDGGGGPAWYRVEVWEGDGPLAITNHIELR